MPAAPDEVLAYAAKLLNYPEPPRINFEEAELSPMAKSFYSDNKRVNNDLIKNEFRLTLKFPNFKAGLDALVGR